MPSTKTIMQIQEEFGKRYPEREKSKTLKGNKISYIPWFEIISIANAVTEGHYDYRIVSAGHSESGVPTASDYKEIEKATEGIEDEGRRRDVINMLMQPKKKYEMTVGVTIYASDGTYYREGTGTEDSSTDNYGDYQSIAESMALRRAFTKFQLGIYMYRK